MKVFLIAIQTAVEIETDWPTATTPCATALSCIQRAILMLLITEMKRRRATDYIEGGVGADGTR